jgi:hypothetical protein
MVYSNGGNWVAVGIGEEVTLAVGVRVRVGVRVIVGWGVGSTTRPVVRKSAQTTAAPIARMITIKPRATGRLIVISGIRGPKTALEVFPPSVGLKVRPQTRQRVAFWLNRVPQVGQVFCGEVDSGLISKFIPGCFSGCLKDYTITLKLT